MLYSFEAIHPKGTTTFSHSMALNEIQQILNVSKLVTKQSPKPYFYEVCLTLSPKFTDSSKKKIKYIKLS